MQSLLPPVPTSWTHRSRITTWCVGVSGVPPSSMLRPFALEPRSSSPSITRWLASVTCSTSPAPAASITAPSSPRIQIGAVAVPCTFST